MIVEPKSLPLLHSKGLKEVYDIRRTFESPIMSTIKENAIIIVLPPPRRAPT